MTFLYFTFFISQIQRLYLPECRFLLVVNGGVLWVVAIVREMSSSLMLPAHCNTIICQHNYFQHKYSKFKYLAASLKPNIFATVEEMSGPLILPAQVSNVATQSFVNTIILNANISNRIMANRICFSQNRHFANTVLNNYHLQLFGK